MSNGGDAQQAGKANKFVAKAVFLRNLHDRSGYIDMYLKDKTTTVEDIQLNQVASEDLCSCIGQKIANQITNRLFNLMRSAGSLH